MKNFDVLLVAAAKNAATSLYNENRKKKSQNILNEENVKIKKQAYIFTGFASSYNVKISNSFNPELQLIDTESAIKIKAKKLLTKLRRLKCVTTLVLVFKKIESDDKRKHHTFYSN